MLRAVSSFVRRATMSSVEKPEVVFVLGGPGAGKGTLCRYVFEKFGYVHLSAGELLREERSKPGSEYGELIEFHIKNGSIVPVDITCSLMERAMRTIENPHKRYLIDGFPRSQDNLDGWDRLMGDKFVLKAVLYCECNEEVCTQRCLKRGAAGSGRTDDNKEVLIRRHNTFIQESLPIIHHYEKLGLVHKINSMKTPDEVVEEVQQVLPEFGW